MKKYTVNIEGMGCMKCVEKVQNALEKLGVKIEKVEIGLAEFSFDGDIEQIKQAILDHGFDIKLISESKEA